MEFVLLVEDWLSANFLLIELYAQKGKKVHCISDHQRQYYWLHQ